MSLDRVFWQSVSGGTFTKRCVGVLYIVTDFTRQDLHLPLIICFVYYHLKGRERLFKISSCVDFFHIIWNFAIPGYNPRCFRAWGYSWGRLLLNFTGSRVNVGSRGVWLFCSCSYFSYIYFTFSEVAWNIHVLSHHCNWRVKEHWLALALGESE